MTNSEFLESSLNIFSAWLSGYCNDAGPRFLLALCSLWHLLQFDIHSEVARPSPTMNWGWCGNGCFRTAAEPSQSEYLQTVQVQVGDNLWKSKVYWWHFWYKLKYCFEILRFRTINILQLNTVLREVLRWNTLLKYFTTHKSVASRKD